MTKPKSKKKEAWSGYEDGEDQSLTVVKETSRSFYRRHGYDVDGEPYLAKVVKKVDLYECPDCGTLHYEPQDAAECCRDD